MKKNRWLIALSAMGIHICIGSVYAWSVLTRPIMQAMGFSLKDTTWTFSLAILFLGLSAGFLGSFVQKIGPRKSGLLAMTFFCSGMFGTAAALYFHSLPLLYLFYGSSAVSAWEQVTLRRFLPWSNGFLTTGDLRQGWLSWDLDLPV